MPVLKYTIACVMVVLLGGCAYLSGAHKVVTALGRDLVDDGATFVGSVLEGGEVVVDVNGNSLSVGYFIRIGVEGGPDRTVFCPRGDKNSLDRICRGLPQYSEVTVRARPMTSGTYEAVTVTRR